MSNSRDTTLSGNDWESDYLLDTDRSSPDQLSIVWTGEGDTVSALPVPSISVGGSYDMDLSRLPSDTNLVPALEMRRKNNLGIEEFSYQTRFLTVAGDFSERTRILALDGEKLALSDSELFEWLINAEREMYLGTDSHPVFEMALEDTACTFSRLPNGQVAMTEVARDHIEATRGRMRTVFGADAISASNLAIETPVRCVARYFLTALPEGAAITRAGRELELTAFLLIGKAGFSYGLWSPSTGLFNEHGFLAPSEISANIPKTGSKGAAGAKSPFETDAAIGKTSSGSANIDAYIKNAFEELILQLSSERLEQLQLSSYAHIIIATERELSEKVHSVAEQYETDTGFEFNQIEAPLAEAVAGGLLFGSFTFGDETAAGADVLPAVNMARDLLVLADKGEVERRRLEEMYVAQRRSQAVFMILALPVFVLACLTALFAANIIEQIVFGVRDVRAEARAAELKPALERRISYEANLKWYQDFITQVSALRRQQPVGIGMLYELNKNYPFDLDPSFYVSDMKLNPGGDIEVTGLARNKDAVTSFLRSLEFAGGPESGSRLFSNLTYEVQEGVAQQFAPQGGQQNTPSIEGSSLSGTGPAPGIIAWTIRGNYLPLAEFIPPDPKAAVANPPGAPPGNPAQTAPAGAPPAGATPPTAAPPAQ